MFSNAFIKLDREEAQALVSEVNPHLKEGKFKEDTATVFAQDMSFYRGYRFLDIADFSAVPTVRKFAIYKPGDITILNWTNEPIYRMNERVPVKLDKDNVADYVRFFFSYIRGRHGRFIIVESVDDIGWNEEPPAAARKAIGQMIMPVEVKGEDGGGTFHLVCCMIFKDSLFCTDVHVKANGTVDLSNEELLIEDVPVQDDIFGQ